MELTDLNKIGLTDGEIKIYLALLDLGESTRTKLAKKSGVSPSKIYDVANRLLEKGMISLVKKNGVIHFSATNPEKIKDYLDKRNDEILKEKEVVNSIMPLLLSKYSKAKEETDIEVFYGWEGMKTSYQDLANSLENGDINYVAIASLGQNTEQSNRFYNRYFNWVKKRGYKQKIIFNDEVRNFKERMEFYNKNKKHEVRFLDSKTYVEFNLYKDTLLIIMLLNNPIVLRIRNKEAADSFKVYFNALWSRAKP